MYQNPDKYDQVLQDTIRKVFNAAPLFQQRFDHLKSVLGQYHDLCNEEEKLNKIRSDELSLYQNGAEKCHKIQHTVSSLKNNYESALEQLKNVALKEAKLANKNGKLPCIFKLKKIQGQTTLINESRINLRLISLQSKLVQKIDKLHELQKNVYCFDELSKTENYNSVFDYGSDLQDISSQSSDLLTSEKISQYLIDIYKDQYQSFSQFIPQKSITEISSSISPSINQIEFPASIPLDIASFKPQQNRKEIDSRQFNNFLSNVASNLEKIFHSEKHFQEKISTLFDEIDTLYQKRQEMLNNFYLSKQDIIPEKIFSCISLLINSCEAVRKAQSVIDILNMLISTNTSIPSSIWENERQIRFKMKQLLNSIDRITNLLSKTQRYVKIAHFGYQEIKDQVEVEEISPTQINQCKELILELQDSLANLEKEKLSSLEEITDTINVVEKIQRDKKEKEDKKKNSKNSNDWDSSTNSFHDLSYIEDEQLSEIMQKRSEFLEKQNEELRKLMEIINAIPDELKEISFIKEDVEFNPPQLPVFQLPPIMNEDENSSSTFQFPYSQSSFTDEISEMNTRYIEQIKAKKFGQKTVNYSLEQETSSISLGEANFDISSTQQQPKTKFVKNEELESIVKSIQLDIKPLHESNRAAQLIEKKNRLVAYVNDLPRKLQHIRELKNEIEKNEKLIKNFPSFKERKMKNLEEKKMKINELNELIKERENSEEYKQYKNICYKIDSIKEDFEGLENE